MEVNLIIEYTLTTSGSKIKALRKKYRLNQADLAGNKIPRTLISYIENDKINLTEKTAKVLVENFNNLSLSRNLKFTIDMNYLIMDIDQQVLSIIKNITKKLTELNLDNTSLPKKDFSDIISFLLNKDFPYEKGIIYELLGDNLNISGNDNVNLSFELYSKAFDAFLQSEKHKILSRITLKIANNRIFCTDYKTVIKYISIAFSFYDKEKKDINRDEYALLFMSLGKAYSNLDEYELSIKNYDIALDLVPDDKNAVKAQILVENSTNLSALQSFAVANDYLEDSAKIFEDLQDMPSYCLAKRMIIQNILDDKSLSPSSKNFKLDRLTSDLLFALKYVDPQEEHLFSSYIILSEIFYYFQKPHEAKEYINLAVQIVMDKDNVLALATIIKRTVSIMTDLELIEEIFSEESLLKLCAYTPSNESVRDAIFLLLKFFLETNNFSKVDFIIANTLDDKSLTINH